MNRKTIHMNHLTEALIELKSQKWNAEQIKCDKRPDVQVLHKKFTSAYVNILTGNCFYLLSLIDCISLNPFRVSKQQESACRRLI